jgi:hypothetical protein
VVEEEDGFGGSGVVTAGKHALVCLLEEGGPFVFLSSQATDGLARGVEQRALRGE